MSGGRYIEDKRIPKTQTDPKINLKVYYQYHVRRKIHRRQENTK